jgi:hypothetical protein
MMLDRPAPPTYPWQEAQARTYYVGVDLGQAQDYTAISIVQQVPGESPTGKPENHYRLRYLRRPDLGTKYPAIVADVLALLGRSPLTPASTLIVDKTGVGTAVVDMFTAAGVRPRAITITGGTAVNRTHPYELSVPKRDLAGLLVALYQGRRLKVSANLALAETLTNELVNFKMKINLQTGHDSYEAWRESIHDDLVLSVAMACWYAENEPADVEALDDDVAAALQGYWG